MDEPAAPLTRAAEAEPPRVRRGLVIALSMAAASALGTYLVPTRRMADRRGGFTLAAAVPTAFGGWQLDPHRRGAVVNPQTETLLRQLYTETLERIYRRAPSERIMLSIAYGADQSDVGMQMHYPEVCYPAQGFQVKKQWQDRLDLPTGRLPVRRLETHFSTLFREPVTYWTVVGDELVLGGWHKRLAEIRHGLRGEIVDGVLVRVSSVGNDSAGAFALQDQFIRDLLLSLTPASRQRIAPLR